MFRSTAAVTITVNADNDAPTAIAEPDDQFTVTENDVVTLDGHGLTSDHGRRRA